MHDIVCVWGGGGVQIIFIPGIIVHIAVPKLPELLKELQSTVADRWEDIGVMLRIPDGSLSQIKTDNGSNCSSCMREMLRFYLRQVAPSPSWEAVAAALESLGLSDTAERIRCKYL